MRPLQDLAAILACTLRIHTGKWRYTQWNRVETRSCDRCGETTYRHAKHPA